MVVLRQIILVFSFTSVLLLHFCNCHNISDSQALRKHLFEKSEYDKRLRPIVNQSESLQVQVKMSLVSISEYDIITGKLKVSGYLTLKWRDELLQWAEDDFAGIRRISVGINDIWVPELQQISENDVSELFSAAWLKSDGGTSLVLAGDLIAYCNVDILYFPLDVQTCGFTLISAVNTASELNLSLMRDSIVTESFIKHGEWKVSDSKAYPITYKEPDIDTEVVGLIFDLKLQRRPTFVLLHTTAPLLLMALLNMMVYVVPILSGERISFSVTILLALIFFTSNIGDDIPHSALNVPIMSMVTLAIITLCTINVIISVLFSRIAANKFRPVSGCLKSFVRIVLLLKYGKTLKTKRVAPKEHQDKDHLKEKGPYDDKEVLPNDSAGDIEITWIMAVDVFDWIMFYVHLLVVAASVVLGTLFVIDVI